MKPMSPALFSAHSSVAHEIANDYLRDLAKADESDTSFSTLETRYNTFRQEYSQRVFGHAAMRGVYRLAVRHATLVELARAEINHRLLPNTQYKLAHKLHRIRQLQQQKHAAAAA